MNQIDQIPCPDCEGRGVLIVNETMQRCCGNLGQNGECCNIQDSYQIPVINGCERCTATGKII